MTVKRKVVLYIAASLDGYIAKPGDNLDFLDVVHEKGQDYGYNEFLKTIDTIIVGRRTYDWVIKEAGEFPHPEIEKYVITRTLGEGQQNLHFFTGKLNELIADLRSKPGKNIFIDGGAEIVNLLLKEKLIDEFIISIIPVLLGEGIRLFNETYPEQELIHIDTKTFSKGLVQVKYSRK